MRKARFIGDERLENTLPVSLYDVFSKSHLSPTYWSHVKWKSDQEYWKVISAHASGGVFCDAGRREVVTREKLDLTHVRLK